MQFRLLGPVEAGVVAEPVEIGPPRQRLVLAALAADAGRPVPAETLIERVWGEQMPQRVRHSLYVYIANLRRLLMAVAPGPGRPVTVLRRSGGYLLDVDPDQVDVHRFRRLVAEARDRGRPEPDRAARLADALELWRGEPLADLHGEWVDRIRPAWRQEYAEVVIAWAEATLTAGDPGAAVARLTDLAERDPLNESLAAALMRVLHAGGRSADALDHYTCTRRRLIDELGTDPGPELQALHQAILRGEQASATPRRMVASATLAQLPADVPAFTGREEALAQLDGLLAGSGRRPPTVVISAIHGTAGVGKTALAVHWAHRVAHRFPDGQLYVNLRGFDPTGQVMATAEAVRGFLDAFGVAPERIPLHLDAQAALYRSLLAGKRILVLLDNARDAEQVRPLLPGGAGCLVVLTSRDALWGLAAAEGATPVRLNLLTHDEAWDLLAHRLTQRRIAAEPRAAQEIIDACARLPLALSVVATRAAARPADPLSVLAGELHEAHDSLDAFASRDPATDVRAVFSWSYHALSNRAAQIFRLLGVHPGADIAVIAAASLAGVPVRQARSALNELADTHLLTEHSTARYTAHDLLRTYAAELAEDPRTRMDRDNALRRVLDHYLHTAYAAARMIEPHRETITLAPPATGVTVPAIAGAGEALDWFVAEHAAMIAMIQQAADSGYGVHAWQLAWTLNTYFGRQGHWHDQAGTQRTALHAAQRIADKTGQAHAHSGLSRAYVRLGRHNDAYAHLQQALVLYAELADPIGQARAHEGLGFALSRRGRYPDAIEHIQRSLTLFAEAGHRDGYAEVLNALGWQHALLGNYEQTLRYCSEALTRMGELADRHGQANTLDSLGYAHFHLGHQDQAIDCYQHALDLFRQTGEQYLQAETLIRLGDTQLHADNPASARTAWTRALQIFTGLDHPDAHEVRAKLDALSRASLSSKQPGST